MLTNSRLCFDTDMAVLVQFVRFILNINDGCTAHGGANSKVKDDRTMKTMKNSRSDHIKKRSLRMECELVGGFSPIT